MNIEYNPTFGQFELTISGCLYDRYFTRDLAMSAWCEYKRNLRYGR